MGLNAWAAALFLVVIVLGVVEYSRTHNIRDLTIAFLGAATAAAFWLQSTSPLLGHP